MKQLRAQVEETTSDYDREKLQERLAKLVGGVAIIKVGAATETEMKEKKARVEDAMHATRAAVEEGIVPGGGVAFLRAIPALEKLKLEDDEQIGVNIVKRALEEPLRLIASNAGHEGAIVVGKVRDSANSQLRIQCRNRRIHRYDFCRNSRSGKGDTFCPSERCLDRGPDAYDGSADRGNSRRKKMPVQCRAAVHRCTSGLHSSPSAFISDCEGERVLLGVHRRCRQTRYKGSNCFIVRCPSKLVLAIPAIFKDHCKNSCRAFILTFSLLRVRHCGEVQRLRLLG